ncbi:MAG: DUF2064 domain-containing protein [Gammaproteobacteria bacterium]|nr:DUF2064 domain-containing protein [Gammaproteobacteria bacterium]NNC97681.1 DUF2064 domain-containing protein [Gammaproteobacteria bacterium]NNM12857.1 DUF2064 domain-containing protein [Gammaproteobacteria bacterium]
MLETSKPEKCAVIVFAKRPRIGQGKQRLAAEIGQQAAFEVATLLLEQTLGMLEQWQGALVVSPSEIEDSDWASQLLQRPVIVIPQHSGGLGERLQQIDNEVRLLGYSSLIFIGSDAPLLSVEQLRSVEKNLDNYAQVFIPAQDGGVTLMASNKPWMNLESVSWSTDKVFSQLKSMCIKQGLNLQIRPSMYDLDDLDACQQFLSRADFADNPSKVFDKKLNTILDTYA